MLYVLNVTRPSNLMPIHGEWRHLRAHAELAGLTGMRRDDVVLADNGVVVDLVDGRAGISGALPCGYVYVDGAAVGDVGEASLKDRRILGDEGFVTITVVVDASTGKVVGGPELFARGFTDELHVFDDARMLVENALAHAAAEGVAELSALQHIVRRTVGRWVSDTYRRRPMIVPVVIEV